MTADPRVIGAILRRDFYSFVRACFPIISPNASFTPNWHIEAMAFALSRVRKGKIKRLIMTVRPRSLKSTCASVAYPAFVIGHDRGRRIICVSYAEGFEVEQIEATEATQPSAPTETTAPSRETKS
jgi:hypothetical protein